MSTFDPVRWFRGFADELQSTRIGPDLVEIVSDSSQELLLNAWTAQSIRKWGRANKVSNWWARCEWGKSDVCWGQATGIFEDWDDAYFDRQSGIEGVLEAKVLYCHYTPAKRQGKLQELGAKLGLSVRDPFYRGLDGKVLGLVWHFGLSEAGPDASLLAEAAPRRRTVNVLVPFSLVAHADLSGVWPIRDAYRNAYLHGALFSVT